MTVAEALTGPFNHLGYQLELLIVKTCKKHGLDNTGAVTEMFINVCGGEDLSSAPAYREVGQSLELFTHTVELSLERFAIIQNVGG